MVNMNEQVSAIIPDINWYLSISQRKGVQPRCPFVTPKVCPRFYQSLSLLGQAGSTQIEPCEDQKLLEYWEKSDLWPLTGEYATSISGPAGKPHAFSNFCPEATFDRFGYFASFLACYADEIDMNAAHKELIKKRAPAGDPRWYWAALSPLHYTECSIYSVLSHRSKALPGSMTQVELPWHKKHLVEIIVGLIVTVLGGLLLKLLV